MSASINFKNEIGDEFDCAIHRVTNALKNTGFGVITRINIHTTVGNKIDKNIPKLVILGTSNLTMAYEAFTT